MCCHGCQAVAQSIVDNEQLQQQLQQTGSIQAVLRKSNTAIDSLQTQNAKLAAEMEGLKSLLQQTADERDKKHGDKLIAAARRDPPLVIGDGTHTIRELVEIVNSDPRRSDGHATSLTKIRFDDIALARLEEQGYNANSVPPRGVRVVLRNNGVLYFVLVHAGVILLGFMGLVRAMNGHLWRVPLIGPALP